MSGFDAECEAACAAAVEAGRIVMSYFERNLESPLPVREKPGGGLVTEADEVSDKVLHERLTAAFPDYGWLSEEGEDTLERLGRERVWIVDSLDGTHELLDGIGEFAVSVALVERGEPVVGVVLNPVSGELFAARRGAGATLGGRPVRVTGARKLWEAAMLASRSENKRGDHRRYEGRFQVKLTGSVAYKLACVAAGKGDFTFTCCPKSEWDICAGTLLVEEAAGRVTGLKGEPIRFNREEVELPGLIATNGHLHDQVIALLSQ